MKIGREVEGRFRGLLTLFLDAYEALEFFNRPSLKVACKNERARELIEKVRHIYISDHTNALKPNDECLSKWHELGFVVCIERTAITVRHLWPVNVSFMLVAPAPEGIWRLEPDDQVKFTSDMNVLSITYRQMDRTYPTEFTGDVEIEL